MKNRGINVWWSGIDKDYCSYMELKKRQVIAQGVPKLGSLHPLSAYLANKTEFVEQINKLGDAKHNRSEDYWWHELRDNHNNKISVSMYNLLILSTGDLVIALEGTMVRGICYLPKDAMESYEYQPGYDYAHAVGFPIKWIDWNNTLFGPPPISPGQSVYGICGLNKQRDYVIDCWGKL